jgi:hypothetical protein
VYDKCDIRSRIDSAELALVFTRRLWPDRHIAGNYKRMVRSAGIAGIRAWRSTPPSSSVCISCLSHLRPTLLARSLVCLVYSRSLHSKTE